MLARCYNTYDKIKNGEYCLHLKAKFHYQKKKKKYNN